MTGSPWIEKSYRRMLIDMHIEDWDERFLSRLDTESTVRLLGTARVQSAMIYANSHVGLCYWPTQAGQMHRNLQGRDILGELVRRSHDAGMDVILYYSLIFNNWAYETHPEWRSVTADGRHSRDEGVRVLITTQGRYGICCPNSPGYRRFVDAQVEELFARYSFEGFFFDMTFWPLVCYCRECRKRYREEVGGGPPTVIDWSDPQWRRFQEKREEWLAEFATFATEAARRHRASVTVEHNSSTFPFDWAAGVSDRLVRRNDYLGGDFYGGLVQQSFICKLFHNLTPRRPFEFMTSRCFPDLRDHSSLKQEELLLLQNAIALMHGGATLFIDAIDPAGTLNPRVYETLGRVFGRTKGCEAHVGGELCQDVGIYFSMGSKMCTADNGKGVSENSGRVPHIDAMSGAAAILTEHHVPYGVIGKANLRELERHQLLLLCDAPGLDDQEIEAISGYVMNGGVLYVSGDTPLLQELLGTRKVGRTEEVFTYIAPTSEGAELFPEIDPAYPLTVNAPQLLVELPKGTGCNTAKVLATITLPYTAPDARGRFASIHSNPPGVATEHPAMVRFSVGKGTVLWTAACLELGTQQANREALVSAVRSMARGPFSFSADAPPAVEVVVFHQPHRRRFLVGLANLQQVLPPVAVHGVTVRLKRSGRKFTRCSLLPEERSLPEESSLRDKGSLPEASSLPFEEKGDFVHVPVPPFELFALFTAGYGDEGKEVTG